MFIASLSIMAQEWKQPSISQLITHKQNVLYPYNGILFLISFKWSIDSCCNINLENIMLKWSQLWKAIYYMTLFIWNVQSGKSVQTKSRLGVTWIQREGWKAGEWQLRGRRVSCCGNENVLKSTLVIVAQVSYYRTH